MLLNIHITEAAARRYSVKKGVPRNLAKSTAKHLCQSLFFNKVAGVRPAALFEKRLWHTFFYRTLGDCFYILLGFGAVKYFGGIFFGLSAANIALTVKLREDILMFHGYKLL